MSNFDHLPPPTYVPGQWKRRLRNFSLIALAIGVVVAVCALVFLPSGEAEKHDSATAPSSSSSAPALVNGIEVPDGLAIEGEDGAKFTPSIQSAANWTAPPKDFKCPGNHTVFYAYQAERGSNAFGPSQVANIKTADDVVKRIREKACDPLWLRGTEEFFKPSGKEGGEEVNGDLIRNEALKLDKNGWKRSLETVFNSIDKIFVADLQVRYESAGMIPGANPNDMPTITKWGDRPVLGMTAIIVLKNGDYRLLRIECDLQWSVKKFEKLRAVERTFKPTGGPPPPRSTTHRPSPPPRTSTQPPPPPTSTQPPCDCTPPPPPPPPPPPTPKVWQEAPGCGGAGDGGPGGCQEGGGDTEGEGPPQAGEPPAEYTPMPVPSETQATPAPTVSVSPAPVEQQPTVDLPEQPDLSEAVEAPSDPAQCGDPAFCG